jgi:2-oxoglutarate dehydrogenase E1 component
MVQAPIFHVNGDDPEACARVARLAFAFRQRFHKDVVIDMVCYRRMGHNEGDDPRLTQPKMYERIDDRRTIRKIYTEALIKRGDISLEEAEKAMEDFSNRLSVALEETRSTAPPKFTTVPPPPADRLLPAVETKVADASVLDRIAEVVTRGAEGFSLNAKLAKVFEARMKLYAEGQVDWALGEAFAYGTLLLEGHDVRLAGQDTRRGTFSHRNAVLVDYTNASEHKPLDHVSADQGRFFIYDSLLSEYAALGFEYGYASVHRNAFVGWEAQFGDFVNGAQIVIDQFLSAAEDKWGQTSGLVLLLPHGYEGQGPEHSSARVERFLQLCANNNMQVVNVTSAAQLFHALRRQVKRTERKPLVVFTTKSGLRATWSRSPIEEITDGAFHEVLDDPATVDRAADVRRVVLATGKVAFDAMKARDDRSAPVAVVRVEQVYPWPEDQITSIIARYEHIDEVVWLQEEPENMGAWSFVHGRMHKLLREDFQLRHVARVPSGSPAAGSSHLHELETADLMQRVFQGL